MLLCICVSVCVSVSVFLCMCVYKHPHKYAQVNKTEGRDGKRKGTDSGLVSWEAQGHLGLAPMDTGDFSLVHGGWETLSPVHACRFEPCTYVWVPKQIVILKGATAHTVGDSVPCANTDSVSHSQGIFAELLVKWPGTHSFVVLWTHESCFDGPLIYKRQREPRELMLTHGSLWENTGPQTPPWQWLALLCGLGTLGVLILHSGKKICFADFLEIFMTHANCKDFISTSGCRCTQVPTPSCRCAPKGFEFSNGFFCISLKLNIITENTYTWKYTHTHTHMTSLVIIFQIVHLEWINILVIQYLAYDTERNRYIPKPGEKLSF